MAKEGYNTKNKSDKASHRSLQYGISCTGALIVSVPGQDASKMESGTKGNYSRHRKQKT
jgi:hypothetical protein